MFRFTFLETKAGLWSSVAVYGAEQRINTNERIYLNPSLKEKKQWLFLTFIILAYFVFFYFLDRPKEHLWGVVEEGIRIVDEQPTNPEQLLHGYDNINQNL